ncbi:hypothetical protein F2Q68_00032299 [Brassica cretica]|nr:hypothetical protein F2Q68_00032299 [Brassica cretica]
MVSPVTVQEVINLAVQDAKEWQSAQAAVASSARNLSAGPPSLPTFDNEKLVCFVDAAWDASTRNCGIAGVFKGREQGKFQSFKDSRRYVDSALITLVKLLKTKGSRTELNNILTDIYYFSSRLKACSFIIFLLYFDPKKRTPEACIHASTSPRPTRSEPMDGQCLTGLCPRPVLTPIKIPLAGFDHASSHLEPKADL